MTVSPVEIAPCPCGAKYEHFRTGLSFGQVRDLMFTNEPPPWRSKSRAAVLGFWRELKVQFWRAAHGGCHADQ